MPKGDCLIRDVLWRRTPILAVVFDPEVFVDAPRIVAAAGTLTITSATVLGITSATVLGITSATVLGITSATVLGITSATLGITSG